MAKTNQPAAEERRQAEQMKKKLFSTEMIIVVGCGDEVGDPGAGPGDGDEPDTAGAFDGGGAVGDPGAGLGNDEGGSPAGCLGLEA